VGKYISGPPLVPLFSPQTPHNSHVPAIALSESPKKRRILKATQGPRHTSIFNHSREAVILPNQSRSTASQSYPCLYSRKGHQVSPNSTEYRACTCTHPSHQDRRTPHPPAVAQVGSAHLSPPPPPRRCRRQKNNQLPCRLGRAPPYLGGVPIRSCTRPSVVQPGDSTLHSLFSKSRQRKRPGQTRPGRRQTERTLSPSFLRSLAGWLSVATIHLSPLFPSGV
jgi:hypothetical protein